PGARSNSDMVYDPVRQNVVLFGGYDGAYLNETWTWDGTTWTQQHPATSPPVRDTFPMAFDSATQTTVLSGGYSISVGIHNDTWTWDGTNWRQQHPSSSPSARGSGRQMAYDAASGQLILFGGGNPNGAFYGDTWEWSGTNWIQLSPSTSPSPRVD